MAEGERVWRWWLGFAVVTVIAAWLSWRAYHEALPEAFRSYDKTVHFTIAGLFAFFLHGATRSFWPVACLLAVFGLEELAQTLTVHRTSSIWDYAADVAGVVVFTALARRVSRPRRAKPAGDVAE